MIKSIIFDMDGVLIEAKNWHFEALNRSLRLFGHEISRYDHLTIYDGLPTSKKLEILSIESGLPRSLHAFINEMKQKYTMEIVHAQCKPTFIHEFALSRLKAQGYRLGVASNSVRHTVDVMMAKAALTGYLDVQFSSEDVIHAKPHPEIYLKAMEALKVAPFECLIVEDNDNGIKAAKASGAHLMEVREVTDVTLANILRRIQEINDE